MSRTTVTIDSSKLRGLFAGAARGGLREVVGQLKEAVKDNVKPGGDQYSRRGRLRNGIVGNMKSDHLGQVEATWIGSRLQELGGTVRPVKMLWLAIPLKPEAKAIARFGYGPRAAGQPFYFLRSKKPGEAFLARSGSPKGHPDIWYLLLNKAEHKARPYMRPALESSKPAIEGWFATGARRALGGTS